MYARRSSGLTPQRLDARRNREVILQVATDAFARGAGVVSLDEIARRAGLGRATVYRHFPDRKALGIAVAGENLKALARGSDGSFRELLHAVLRMQVEQRSLVRLFRQLPERARCRYTEALLALLGPAFHRAQDEGSLRPDLELADLPIVFEMLEGALHGGRSAVVRADTVARAAATERLVQVLLDGLFSERAA